MSTARRILLLAALLLLTAEGVSLSLLVRSIGERQAERLRVSKAQAAVLLPRIVDWLRLRGDDAHTADPWIEPFDELSVESRTVDELDEESRSRLHANELSAQLQPQTRSLTVLGQAQTDHGIQIFRLTQRQGDTAGAGAESVVVAQHALILITALLALLLAALAREPVTEGNAIGAYEEAMSRLKQRDHERLAAFETERAALTSTLRDREAMARAGELTAGIVHEVGNSIGAIAINARLAEKSADERVQAAGAAIAAEVRTIQSVMNRFVNFIKTEEVRWERFDLEKLLKRIGAREAEHCGTPIEVSGNSVQVLGDEDLLERAIENVVRNACQAAGPSGHVSVTFGVDGDQAIVHVVDDGPGIADPEKALRPFESNRPGGLGLGLPLVLKILSLHNGTLDLARDLRGRGTRAVCRWSQTLQTATIGNANMATGDRQKS